jgi:hypothetical protein
METAIISANIRETKKVEFYQTMESLKILVKDHCTDLEFIVNDDNALVIQVVFEDREELESNFYNNEFNILKGSVRSVCDDVDIKINC